MSEKVQCATHGECDKAFLCTHLTGEATGLAFNHDELAEDNQFPDAWCDDCEIIREAHGGWNDESAKLTKIRVVCSRCYERARILNSKPNVSFEDLASLRWKCSSCEEWHNGPALDFAFSQPAYWLPKHAEADRRARLSNSWSRETAATFLDEGFCAIESRDFFVRGLIHLPIIGCAETFRWGVWGSLSHDNFKTLLRMNDDWKRVELPAMFSWLSTNISEYPETLSLRMWAKIQPVGQYPHFQMERADHPLAREYFEGISPERVREIMMGSLKFET